MSYLEMPQSITYTSQRHALVLVDLLWPNGLHCELCPHQTIIHLVIWWKH